MAICNSEIEESMLLQQLIISSVNLFLTFFGAGY